MTPAGPRRPTRRGGAPSRLLEGEDGYAGTPIAFALVLLLTFALFQFGFWYVGQTAAQAAADNAYQQARSYQATDADGVQAGDESLAADSNVLRAPTVTVTRTAQDVTVTVTGHALVMIPALQLPQITVTRTGPIEQWVPAP